MKKIILFMFLLMTASTGYTYEISFMNNSNKYFTIKYPYEILQNVFNYKIVKNSSNLALNIKLMDYPVENYLHYTGDINNCWSRSGTEGNSYTYHKINMKHRPSFFMSDKQIRSITSSIGFAFTGKIKYLVNNNVSINFSTDALMRMLQIMGGTFGRNDSIRVNAYVSYRF